jgi:inosose dehydratase
LPDVPSVLSALSELDAELFVVVEQDMYPVGFDVPLPIATRTRKYLNSEGLGT